MRNSADLSWKGRLSLPAYRVGEAASFARISPQTVAAWEKSYHDRQSVLTAREQNQGLNFLQLIEVAVVAELRRAGLSMNKIRDARDYFVRELQNETPFATHDFKTDGADILQEMTSPSGEMIGDKLLAANSNGQLVWVDLIGDQFTEFRYGDGMVISWHVNGPKSDIVIDPKVSFGAPTIRGIMTRAIKNEWATGSTIDAISDDFDLSSEAVKDALEFEGVFLEEITVH